MLEDMFTAGALIFRFLLVRRLLLYRVVEIMIVDPFWGSLNFCAAGSHVDFLPVLIALGMGPGRRCARGRYVVST